MAIYNMIWFIFILWTNISSSTMTWKVSNVPIPALENKRSAFIAYYNNTIQIFGGDNSENDFVEFPLDVEWSISTRESITFGRQWTPASFQIDEQLWMLSIPVPSSPQYINVYDLAQKNIIKKILFLGSAKWGRCVVSYNEFIFIIGGYFNINYKEFHIYNRNTTNWSTGTSLNNATMRHSCNVVGNNLYIIGGLDFDIG
eukprot:285746_1